MKPNRNFWNKNKIHNNASLFWGGQFGGSPSYWVYQFVSDPHPGADQGARVPGLPVMAVGGFKSWVPVVGGGLGWVGLVGRKKDPWNTHTKEGFFEKKQKKNTPIYIPLKWPKVSKTVVT